MGRYARRKGKPASCKGIGRRGGKTKTKTRDLDQINGDMLKDENFVKLVANATAKADSLDVNGEPIDQAYCVECARHFQSEDILLAHQKSKQHKQRVKKLKDWPQPETY